MADLCGIIAVNKPEGWTSFDVCGKLRGVLKTKRIGHAGTLDPMATGVLPIFVGKATKCCGIMPDKKKAYTAGFRLGLSTDTQDITGEVLSSCEKAVAPGELEKAAEKFVGRITQIPPMYSAVKVGGKKLYELAREGKTVERKPRNAVIYSLEIVEFNEQSREGIMKIECGEGTYVRTIINDIGEVLGAGGVMTSLCRTLSNGFSLGDCVTIDEIEAAEDKLSLLMSPDKAFESYPRIDLAARETALYKNGVQLGLNQVRLTGNGELYRVYGENEFLGLCEIKEGGLTASGKRLKSFRNFY